MVEILGGSVDPHAFVLTEGFHIAGVTIEDHDIAFRAVEGLVVRTIQPEPDALIRAMAAPVYDALWNTHAKPYTAARPTNLAFELLDLTADTAVVAARLYMPTKDKAAQVDLAYYHVPRNPDKVSRWQISRKIVGRTVIDNPYRVHTPRTGTPSAATPLTTTAKLIRNNRSY